MEPPGRRGGGGAARGPAGMEAPGGAAVAKGPPRFQCPEEFCARRFVPGPALCPETLRGRAKQLLLIRAPASFSPESLTGHTVPLCGSRVVKASQPGGARKVYSLQVSPEDPGSGARLLIPSGQPGRLICAPPFSGSLSIRERYGEPGAAQSLHPVAGRPAGRAPEGLRQRFFPFGGCPKRPPPPAEPLEKTPRRNSSSKPQRPPGAEGVGGVERLPGCLTEPARGLLVGEQVGTRHRQRPQKGEVAALLAPWALGLPLERSDQPGEGLLWGGEEGPERRKRKKKKKKEEENQQEAEELPDPNSNSEWGPWLQVEAGPKGGGAGGDPAVDSALGWHKPKQRLWEVVAEGLQGVAAIEGDTPSPGSPPEASWGPAKEEPGCKKKKKRKEEKGGEGPPQELGAETRSLESSSLAPDWEAWGVWREAGPEDPQQPDGAAPSQRPRKKRRKRRGEEGGEVQREDQAGLSAAGS